jgi:dihydropyrimidinase
MMELDLVIHGGKLITPEGILEVDLGVSGEKISAIGRGLVAEQIIDACGLLVLPGGVDPHVHLEMPTAVTVTSDDWESGTRAAACGGTTTVIDFVEPKDGQLLLEAFHLRRAQAEGCASVDFGLHMTLTRTDLETLSQVQGVNDAGLHSFKMYTTYPGFALDDHGLIAAFEAVAEVGGIALVHAENDAIVQRSQAKLVKAGNLHPRFHPRSRPALAEVEAIQRVIALAKFCGVSLYIVHVSTTEGLAAIERARHYWQDVQGETCPQYLLLDESRFNTNDAREASKFVCAPPLRTAGDSVSLWRALASGDIATIGTDHCAFNVDGQKDLGLADFRKVPGGLPGIESRLTLMHTYGVVKGRITLQQWVDLCCANPARIFGLWPRKGSLKIGADADIILFDPQREVSLTHDRLHEQVDYTPYEGFALSGYPVATFLRGRLIAQENKIVAPGYGKFVNESAGTK